MPAESCKEWYDQQMLLLPYTDAELVLEPDKSDSLTIYYQFKTLNQMWLANFGNMY